MKKQYTGPWRLAHRGICQVAPENTLEAFRAAYHACIEGLAIDIRMTKDGEIVILHDDSLVRMTSGSQAPCARRVEQCTWAELQALELPYANHLLDNWKPEGVSEGQAVDFRRQLGNDPAHPYSIERETEPRVAKIMRLYDLFTWVNPLTRRVILEIGYQVSGMMPELCKLLSQFSKRNDCIIFAGECSLIEEVQAYAAAHSLPDGVKLGANIRRLTEDWKKRIEAMNLFEVALDIDALNREDIAWLRSKNIVVFANLGDTPEGWTQICTRNLTGFKSNYTAQFTQWWQEWKS